MIKRAIFLLGVVFAQGMILQANQATPPLEEVQIVIHVKRPCKKDDSFCQKWERMCDNVAFVAESCKNCNSSNLHTMITEMCACVQEIGEIMNTDPLAQGGVTITVKDEESQIFRGQVTRK